MDGWIVVGTKLDSKQLDKDLNNAKKELERFEKENEKLTKKRIEIELDLSQYDKEKEKIEQATNEMLKKAQTEEQVSETLALENGELGKLNEKYTKMIESQETINRQLQENVKNQSLVNGKIDELNVKLSQAKGLNSMKSEIEGVGKSLGKSIKSVGKFALAVFSIRSAYMGIKSAISTVSQYNSDMASKIESMKFTLAAGFEPILVKIVDLFYKLVQYTGYLIKEWTGIDIFANAEKSLKNANKQAKALNKQLAGFDEMNVLQDTSSSGGTGGAGIISIPELPEQEVPEWLKTIKEIGLWIIENWSTVVGTLLLIKLFFDVLTGNWIGIIIDIILFIISQLPAIMEAIDGLWEGIQIVFGWIVDGITYIFTHMDEVLGAIGNAIGVCVQFIIDIVVGLIKGIIDVIGGIVSWIYDNIIKPIIDFFVWLFNTIVDGAVSFINGFFNVLKGVASWVYDNIIKPVIDFFSGLIDNIVNGFKTGLNLVKNIFSTVFNTIKGIVTKVWDGITGLFSKGGKIFDGLKDGIVGAFKTVVNTLIDGINKVVSIPFTTVNGLLNKIRNTDILGVKPFKGLWDQDPLPVPQIPKLAKGGIISRPGPGVAIGGESGMGSREGVIPLTDSQQMALLGEAIGKYITINANITNTMNGRVISRELQKVQNESNFAFNQ